MSASRSPIGASSGRGRRPSTEWSSHCGSRTAQNQTALDSRAQPSHGSAYRRSYRIYHRRGWRSAVAVVRAAQAFLVDVAVERVRQDAVQAFHRQETIFVELATDDGLTGLGYSYTIGTGGTAVLALLRDHLLPRLAGMDSRRIEWIWRDLFAATRATTVGAVTSLALAAVDTALWDLRCRRAGEPLWRVAGGFRARVPMYDTENGWLQLSTDDLVTGAKAAAEAGWHGVKIKIGKPAAVEDFERLEAVRGAVGPRFELMVDANQSMTAAEAIRR